MSGSIWTGVSGLNNHQTWMDTIGNNIANSNTTGYKASRFEFEDILSQSVKGAAPPAQGGVGGTDPEQVGLGTTTGSVDTLTTQGSLQQTNIPTDLAVVGSGYFVTGDGSNTHYTRDSVYHVDAAGNIVSSSNGLHLMGFGPNATNTGVLATRLVNLTVPQTVSTANTTTFMDVFGNLDSRATSAVTQVINVFDSLGQSHPISLTFTPNPAGSGNWTLSATSPDLVAGTTITPSVTGLVFNAQGQLTTPATGTPITMTFSSTTPWVLPGTTTTSLATQTDANGNATEIQLTDAAVGNLTSFAASTSVSSQQAPNPPTLAAGTAVKGQSGNPAGFLKSFSVGPDGTILGQYTSGFTAVLGQVVVATFTNPGGLQRIGQNDWDVSSNSGQANINIPGSGPSGTVAQGSIETSNVDLANELAAMILAERGFQANSKIITTSDEMLQDVVGMKR